MCTRRSVRAERRTALREGCSGVERVDVIAATSEWIKYKLVLKTGRVYIATFLVLEAGNKKKQISMGLQNFEWWLAGILYR